ncbi:hypothetical protein BKA59DRAFT_439214 [Fusarium tricinctum]|uniref:Protein kinase domain-containing protein n=1 Tax=Fusarium tricinctum TaxID=61284 RepID=A0A8K0WCM2_9HYPO|nr:hypothetical protein BKA59DRAFT_439214 [Fusarium tricinctum]
MATPDPSKPATGDSVYAIGSILQLKTTPDATSGNEATILQVKVKKQQRPWTLSCGMIVEIQQTPENIPGLSTGDEVFLKMFDRRFAEQIREDNGTEPWSEAFEQDFAKDLASGKVEKFLEKLRTVPNFKDDTEEDWDNAENEAYLASALQQYFDAETATYARLQQYQGRAIPRLLAPVALHDTPSNEVLSTQQRKLKEHKGILLQYLPGFSLSEMIQNAPRTSWQGIVDEAVQKVHLLGDHNILNKDVRPANFMVVPKNGAYRVFMIDFGQCRFRRKDETDAEWGRAKRDQDEEGAVALVMEMRLKRVGFELQYEQSPRYSEWARGEFDYD